MGKKKKNKKIKSRCHNCGQRNKYAPEHWQGRSKTKCKNCGEFLDKVNKIGNNNQNTCKEVRNNMENQNMNPELYEITRPVRNKQIVKKKRWYKRWWLMTLIVLFIFGGWITVVNVDSFPINPIPMYSVDETNIPQNTSLSYPGDPELCSQLKVVPAWAKDGEVKKRGYAPLRQSVDYLIKNEIIFLYTSTCPSCKNKIEDFGNDWQRYVDSGLTQKCF